MTGRLPKSRYPEWIISAAVLILLGCAGADDRRADGPPSDGNGVGRSAGVFNERWWNFYERGRSNADFGYLVYAREDFEKAIALRADDRWRARTYGMHFLDYFPKRELGILLLQQGDPEGAIHWLESSLRDEPSSRAEYFLREAHRDLLKAGPEDNQGPVIQMVPEFLQLVNTNKVLLTGTITAPSGVDYYRIDRETILLSSATQTVHFQYEKTLNAPGRIRFPIVAYDLRGRLASEDYQVLFDHWGPEIHIFGAGPFFVSVSDLDDRIAEVRFDETVVLSSPGEYFFNTNLADPFVPSVITARDRAGNITRLRVLEEIRSHSGLPRAPYQVAGAGDVPTAPAPKSIRVALESLPARTTSRDLAVNFYHYSTKRVTRVAINEYEVPDLGRQNNQALTLLYRLPSEERVQTITVTAENREGEVASASAVIIYEPDPVDLPASKLRLAVVPPADNNNAMLQTWSDVYTSELAATRRFFMLDRELLPDVLLERLIAGDIRWTTAEAIAQLQVRHAYRGNTPRFDGFEMEGRLVATANGENLPGAIVYLPAKSLHAHRYYLKGLARLTMQQFPRVAGEVIARRGRVVTVNRGTEDGVWGNAPAAIIHRLEDEPAMIISGWVKEANRDSAKIEIPDRSGVAWIQEGDGVVLK